MNKVNQKKILKKKTNVLLSLGLLGLFVGLYSPHIGGASKTLTAQAKLSADIKSIRVEAYHAHIHLLPLKEGKKAKPKELKVEHPAHFKIEEQDSTLVVSEEGFPNQALVELGSKKPQKPPKLTVFVPPFDKPLKVTLFSGKISVQNLKKQDLSLIIAHKGSVRVTNSKGRLNIFQQTGNINIVNYQGKIRAQAENSLISIASCKGEMHLSSFKGQMVISRSSGTLFTHSFKAPLTLNHFTGQLRFQQEKGGVYFKPLTGSVTGYSREGEIRGSIKPHKVKIETQRGKINLNMPGSGAWLTAQTWEGKIFTPPYFRRIKTGGMERAKGRLRASQKKTGSVFLKSHSGSIRVSQASKKR